MSQTTLASCGRANCRRVEEAQARGRRASRQASARRACRSAQGSPAPAPRGADRGVLGGGSSCRVLGSSVDGDERGGCGMAQFWVFMPSRSEPTATTRSAWSHSAPTAGTCGGKPTRSGCPSGITPRPVVGLDHRRAEPLGQRDDLVPQPLGRRRRPRSAAEPRSGDPLDRSGVWLPVRGARSAVRWRRDRPRRAGGRSGPRGRPARPVADGRRQRRADLLDAEEATQRSPGANIAAWPARLVQDAAVDARAAQGATGCPWR